MSKPKLKRPAPGTVLGALALIVAVAGNANALAGGHHALVRKGDIAKGAVTARALAKGAVHPKALAKNAVHASALAKGAVTAKALHSGAVTSAALRANAVTANAIAPDSVHGYALGPVSIHAAPLADPDTNPDFNWEKSTVEIAQCGVGERLLSGGVRFPLQGIIGWRSQPLGRTFPRSRRIARGLVRTDRQRFRRRRDAGTAGRRSLSQVALSACACACACGASATPAP